jgi:probable rRNA maturation factor
MNTAGAEPAALEIEVIVDDGVDPGASPESLTGAAAATLERLGVSKGHVAIEIVDESRIHELNLEYRAKDKPTDVLSFPVDGEEIATGVVPAAGAEPVELGDVVICPPHTEDMVEATVHGILHLCGFDHESDSGEMLALQDEIVDRLRASK